MMSSGGLEWVSAMARKKAQTPGGVAKLRQAEALIRQGTAAADTVRVIALTEPS
jgi:hypothetical protein